jgi:glycosyltransferase involved in cell wall biosynthesis
MNRKEKKETTINESTGNVHPELPNDPQLPSVTVLVRSYHRKESMLELVTMLLKQDHPDYEILVVEQSEWTESERAPLDKLSLEDSRLRILYRKPLGLGGCRNEGLKHANKEILLSFDDDDLPLGTQVVSRHARNYLDPTIVAVTGRHVYTPDEKCGYSNRRRARQRCLKYNFFGYPHAYCRFDERVKSVDWLHGTNGSIRVEVARRTGGWGPSTENDEHTLCLPLQNKLGPGERLIFDPAIKMLRRKTIPGGAAVQYAGPRHTFASWHRYYHHLVIPNKGFKAWSIYPVFPLVTVFTTLRWIWKDSAGYSGVTHKLLHSFYSFVIWPLWYLAEFTRFSVHPLHGQANSARPQSPPGSHPHS